VDFSLVKDTQLPFLGEQGRLQFRTEIFNLFNHPSFGVPDRTAFAGSGSSTAQSPRATAGRITTTSSNSREFQLALKIIF
jgi:hypothetical protein